MPCHEDKARLLGLLYDAKHALTEEKGDAWDKLNVELDRVRAGSVYSRNQLKELLLKDGYAEYARRRRLAERAGL